MGEWRNGGATVAGPVLGGVDRKSTIEPASDITAQFLWGFLTRGLSPAVSGEESGWVLWVEGDGGCVSDWRKRAGSGALTVSVQKNAELRTVGTSTGNLPSPGVGRQSTANRSGCILGG